MQFPEGNQRRIRILVAAATAVMTVGGIAYGARTPVLPKAPEAMKGKPGTDNATAAALSTPTNVNPQEGTPTTADKKASAATAQKPKVQVYAVADGDTIEAIASKFGLKSTTVLWANNLAENDVLKVGQELSLPSVDGLVLKVAEGDTLWDVALDHKADMDEIIKANPEISGDALRPGDVLVIPGGKPAERRQVASRSSGESQRDSPPAPAAKPASSGRYQWPTTGMLTDYFGWRTHPVYGTRHFHDGIDINAPTGTPIGAAKTGTVTMADWYGGYGISVKMDHGDGTATLYSHLSRTAVRVGQHVQAGELVGSSGSTGASTGAHLHFSIFVGGSPVNPLDYLP